MKLSKLTLATAGIFMGISLAACTATNSKPSEPSLTHDYAGCISVPGEEQEKASTAAIAQKAQRRKTSNSEEPEQDLAGCILVPDSK